MFNYFSNDNLRMHNNMSATISIKNWFALLFVSFLAFIPLIGPIFMFVSYLVIAFKKETAPSIANFLKAYFLLVLIAFAVGIGILLFLGGVAQELLAGFAG